MTPGALLRGAGKEAGRVDEHDEAYTEAVAQVHEPRALLRRLGVEDAAQAARLVGHDPHGPPLQPREADDQVARPAGGELEQRAGVDQAARDVADVVDRARIGRHGRGGVAGRRPEGRRHRQRASRMLGKVGRRSRTSARACASSEAARWATPLEPCTRGPPSSSAVTRSRRAASTTRGPVRNMRASGPAITVDVAQRGRVGGAARAHAADHADLGHVGQGLRAEDGPVGAQRAHALLQARPARERGSRRPARGRRLAMRMTREIVSPPAVPRDPPLNACCWPHTNTGRPPTRPLPARPRRRPSSAAAGTTRGRRCPRGARERDPRSRARARW